MSDNRISQAEMREMFGEEMPAEAINLLWNAPPEKTLAELRDELREMAKPTPVTEGDELEREAWEWINQMVEAICDEHACDLSYSADQMVDAYIAGRTKAAARIQSDAVTIERMREGLGSVEDRFDYAMTMYHDATRWAEEDSPDPELSLLDYVFEKVRAILTGSGCER